MNLKKVLLVTLAVFLCLATQSCKKESYICSDSIECVTYAEGEAIKIAVLQPLSGRLKNSGTVQQRGIDLALDRRGREILGHSIELVLEDSQCSSEGGANAALKVVSDPKIIGIIGTNCSGAAAEVSKIMTKAGLVMISGTNSAASLTATDGKVNSQWNPGYFRTMYNSLDRGKAGALYTYNELGIKKAATIHDGDNRSIELAEKFEKTFTEIGGEIVLSTAIDPKDTNMRPVLQSVVNSGADMIFYPFFPPETVYLTKQAKEIPELKDKAFMVCGSTMRADSVIEELGESGIGLYFLGKAKLSGKVFEDLQIEYNSRYTDLQDDTLYAFAFDATNILLDAIEASAETDKDGNTHIGRQKLRDAMYNTKDHNGATGILSSNEFGDCGTPKFNILQLLDPSKGNSGLLDSEVFTYTPEK